MQVIFSFDLVQVLLFAPRRRLSTGPEDAGNNYMQIRGRTPMNAGTVYCAMSCLLVSARLVPFRGSSTYGLVCVRGQNVDPLYDELALCVRERGEGGGGGLGGHEDRYGDELARNHFMRAAAARRRSVRVEQLGLKSGYEKAGQTRESRLCYCGRGDTAIPEGDVHACRPKVARGASGVGVRVEVGEAQDAVLRRPPQPPPRFHLDPDPTRIPNFSLPPAISTFRSLEVAV